MYSFEDIKQITRSNTVVTTGHHFISASEDCGKALKFRQGEFTQSTEYEGEQGVMLIYQNNKVLRKSSRYIHELSYYDEDEVLIAPWVTFKIVQYYYKYKHRGTWKDAKTDREIHSLLEMDDGTPGAHGVEERWQYLVLEAVE